MSEYACVNHTHTQALTVNWTRLLTLSRPHALCCCCCCCCSIDCRKGAGEWSDLPQVSTGSSTTWIDTLFSPLVAGAIGGGLVLIVVIVVVFCVCCFRSGAPVFRIAWFVGYRACCACGRARYACRACCVRVRVCAVACSFVSDIRVRLDG